MASPLISRYLLDNCHKITNLYVNDDYFEIKPYFKKDNFNHLEFLTLDNFGDQTFDFSLISHFPLKRLRIDTDYLELDLQRAQINIDNQAEHLAKLTSLESLTIGYRWDIEPKLLNSIGTLTNLSYLNISIIGDVAPPFSSLTKLTHIKLDLYSTDDKLMQTLGSLVNLTCIEIGTLGEIKNNHLTHLAQLKNLRALELYVGYVVYDGSEEMQKMLVTDKSITEIGKMTSLSNLFIEGTFTDKGLMNLSKLTSLTKLKLKGNEFTQKGVAELKKISKRTIKTTVIRYSSR